jgi:hypothetical protein
MADGPTGPTASGPSAMDLENNRFKFIFAKWGSSDSVAKFRIDAAFHEQHGYRRTWLATDLVTCPACAAFAALLWHGSQLCHRALE